MERRGRLLAAQAGESTGIVGVDGGGAATSATGAATREAVTTARSTSTGSTAGSTSATVATLTTTATTLSTTASGTSAALPALTGAVGSFTLNIPGDDLLRLGVALAQLLASRGGDEILLGVILDEGLAASPLLLLLGVHTLVGLASGCADVQGSILLGQLGIVGIERDLLGLRLLSLVLGILSLGILLLGLSNGLTGLLVVELGSTLGGTPRLSSLLLGTTANAISSVYFSMCIRGTRRLTALCS